MKEIKAPQFIPRREQLLFLAGSIEIGVAENWQTRVVEGLKDTEWTVLNPRRDDWNSSWVQSIENEKFVEQVSWELDGMERAKKIVMYFDPRTKSPITLSEFGLWGNNQGNVPSKLLVCCPDGFWRKGNIDVVCARYNIPQFNSMEEIVAQLQ